MSMRHRHGEGPNTARVVVIGESFGAEEERLGRPFVGPTGRRLDDWLLAVGLQRSTVRIENVVERRPAGNDIATVPPAELAQWVQSLHERLGELADPYVIVPTGRVALEALTSKKGITKHRGSIYEYIDVHGRTVKCIPTLHPAATFRQPYWTKRCLADWRRIASDARFRELRLPEREHFIRPTLDDVRWYVAEAQDRATVLSIDIETPRRATYVPVVLKSGKPGKPKRTLGEPYIACVGFAFDPAFGFCVPTTEEYWGSRKRTAEVWSYVRALCESGIEKVLQNGGFDSWWLRRERGIAVRNYRWDTANMSRVLDPCDDHDLAYLASTRTREPYWKDEAKDADEIQKYMTAMDAFWTYNSKDATVQRELYDVLRAEIDERGCLHTYLRMYRNTYAPLLDVSLTGIAVDGDARRAKYDELTQAIADVRAELTDLAGVNLYGSKALSPKKLGEWLYGTLRLPKQLERKTGKVSTKEVVVRRLMQRYPDKLRRAGDLILRQRRYQQLRTFVSDTRVAADGRFRSSYGHAPETGRLSSTKAPDRTGGNAQNQDREIRSVFVPDDGCVFLEGDLSQAESRVVGVLTRDPVLVEIARTPPWAFDVHRANASVIFRVPEDRITKEQRYLGKRAIHASNYGMHGKKLAEELLKDGYVLTPDECETMIESYMMKYPAIRAWHRRVRQEIFRTRRLTNAFGFTISFEHERMDDDLYRRAFAFKPQSSVAQLMNLYGLVPMWRAYRGTDVRLNAHIHDALLVSVPPDQAYDVAVAFERALAVEVMYDGEPLSIPVEFKLGASWAGDHEFKRLPSRREFTDAAWAVYERTKYAREQAREVEVVGA